jgi:hypothetical protein
MGASTSALSARADKGESKPAAAMSAAMTKRIFLALFNDSANILVITLGPRLWQKLPCNLAFGRQAPVF